MNKNNTRFYEIDFLRFVAAIAVVLFHYMFRGFAQGGYNPISYAPFDQYAQYGYLGVHLFFMISGFVILLTAMKRDVFQFVISRIVRLYPAFWAGVTFTTIMIVFFGGELFSVSFPQYLSNLSMIDGYLGVEPIDGVYWTLLVEIKFYALIFVLLLLKRIENIDWFLAAWLVMQIIDIVMPLPKIVQFLLFPEWAPYFVSGALFYLLKLKGMKIEYLVLLAISFGLAIYQVKNEVITLSEYYSTVFNPIIPMAVVAFFFLIFSLILANKFTFFRSTWVLKVGALTYPLYLVHQNVGFMMFNLFEGMVNKYILLVAVIVFALLVAWLIHRLVEKNLSLVMKNALNQLEYKAKILLSWH